MDRTEIDTFKQEAFIEIASKADTVFPEYEFKRVNNGWEAKGGEDTKGHLFLYDNSAFCFKNHKTGDSVNIEAYIGQRDQLQGYEILQRLSELSGLPLPSGGWTEGQLKDHKAKKDIIDTAYNYFQATLWKPEGKEALDYLKGRSYTEELIKAMELGAYAGWKTLEGYLKGQGHTEEAIKKVLPYSNYRKDYKVIFPYRDTAGQIKSLWARRTGPEKEKKYLPFTAEATKETPFNMDRAKGQERLIITEGYLDALMVRENIEGYGVIAIGGAQNITGDQIDRAVKLGAKYFYLALDSDKAGEAGIEKALNLISKKGHRAFIVDLPAGEDPDSFIIKKGAEAFGELVATAESGAIWKTKKLIKDCITVLNNEAEKEILIDNAFNFLYTLEARETDRALELIAEATGTALEALKYDLGEVTQRRERQGLQDRLKGLLEGGTDIKNIGTLEKEIQAIRLEIEKTKTPPIKPLDGYLEEKYKQDSNRTAGSLLGYGLTKFEQIAKDTDGIQKGFYILGAETNIGKTAFLCNLFKDILGTNKDIKGLYYSLDDHRDIITNRLIAISTGLPLNSIQKAQEDPADSGRIKGAYDKLKALYREERLNIKDQGEVHSFTQLETDIREQIEDPKDPRLFVIIDDIQNLPVEGQGGIREDNIERANKVKTLVDTYRIPIITTAELRKPERKGDKPTPRPTVNDIIETSKFAYNANLVWLLYRDRAELEEEIKLEKEGLDIPEGDKTLILKYGKNKLSHFKGYRKLTFKSQVGALEVKQKERFK